MTPADVRALYERFGLPIYRRCLRILRDPARAEDALQDVFVRVLRYGDGYQGGPVLTWLMRIGDRVALDRLARDGDGRNGRPARATATDLHCPCLHAAEASALLSQLLGRLPRRLQEVAVLTYVDGMSQSDMATSLGCSTRTVKRRLRTLHRHARQLGGADGEEEVDHVEDPA